MNITKYGHACLVIEQDGVRIMLDPGVYSTAQNDITNIDAIVITHEHKDHCDADGIKKILAASPDAVVITNASVSTVLAAEGISSQIVEDGQSISVKGVEIAGEGKQHAVLHPSIPVIANTGYWIGGRLFYPGDSLVVPAHEVEILALPVAGPWLKISEAIDYAISLKPKKCFPVHDGMLNNTTAPYFLLSSVLEKEGIPFEPLDIGKVYEF